MSHPEQTDGDTMVMTSFRISKRQKALLNLCVAFSDPRRTQADIIRQALDNIIDHYANMSEEELKAIAVQRVSLLQGQLLSLGADRRNTPLSPA